MFAWGLLAVVALESASAGTIEAFYDFEFGYGPLNDQGWTNGYWGDDWWGEDGMAFSSSDDSVDSDGVDALHNYLIRGDLIQQGVIKTQLQNDDNDTIGVVTNCQNGYYYLIGHSRDSSPPPLDSVQTGTVFLIKIENYVPTLLDSVETGPLNDHNWNTLEVTVDNGVITVALNTEDVLSFSDPSPLPAGQWGFYAYNSGWSEWESDSNAYFDDIGVYYVDEDDDGVADDIDNCETHANPEQEDLNENGIGDDCEEDGDADTDSDSDSDADTDSDSDSDADSTPGGGNEGIQEGITGAGKCACNTPASLVTVPWMFGGLAALLGIRRRRL